MNSSNFCNPCDAICYKCVGTSTYCTACSNSQNRVLNGNQCACDPIGYYDDGSLVCALCHYSCKSCNGGSSGNCLTCDSGANRYKLNNTCPCIVGYYDPGAKMCVACHYTCQTATCTGSTSTKCASCNTTKSRSILASNYTCPCASGYYDNNTSSEQCAPCRYSC
jgi:proprotein convertase subtilisin/kexin type 5